MWSSRGESPSLHAYALVAVHAMPSSLNPYRSTLTPSGVRRCTIDRSSIAMIAAFASWLPIFVRAGMQANRLEAVLATLVISAVFRGVSLYCAVTSRNTTRLMYWAAVALGVYVVVEFPTHVYAALLPFRKAAG